MSITDELREYASTRISPNKGLLLAIADRIDAEHEAMLVDARKTVYQGYIELPKDADGVPWHIGDRTESGQTIEAMGLNKNGWHFVGTVNEIDPAIHRHHHTPTVEDVLRGVVTLCHNTWKEESAFHFYGVDDVMESGNIADFAAKLRLAGDAE